MAATSTTAAQDTRPPRRLFKKGSAIRRPARWNRNASTLSTRKDGLILSRWERAATGAAAAAAAEGTEGEGPKPYDRFARFNVDVEAPTYDDELYENHLKSEEWSKQETDLLVETYRECNGKWPVIVDHYVAPEGCKERSMEELKARFYSISATLLQLATPITSMTAAEYARYEMLSSFNASQETSRKKLAEGHLYRKANEVDEETVLLGELQRIMLNQATLDGEREVCPIDLWQQGNTILNLTFLPRSSVVASTILTRPAMDTSTPPPPNSRPSGRRFSAPTR